MLLSVSAAIAAPVTVLVPFAAKASPKIFGLCRVFGRLLREHNERWFYNAHGVERPHVRHRLGTLRSEPWHRQAE